MSETTTNSQENAQVDVQNVQETAQSNVQFNPFADNSWSESPIKQQQVNETADAANESSTTNSQDQEEEEIVDSNEWLKREFNWDSAESAKAEIEELRKLKESATTKEDLKFANEQSQKFFELLKEGKEDDLYDFLENKKRIDRITSVEVNKETAADIIKLNMQKKYKDLTTSEIEYKFNKQFGIPNRPVQTDMETDEEYQSRISSWESKVNDVETEMLIEAKLARPELEKLKSEIVLPDIAKKEETGYELTQEELEAQQAFVNSFKQNISSTLKSFDGFSVSVKDEEVEIPISYSISDEERGVVSEQLERFADSNFDANVILAERWLNEDGSLNTQKVVKDLALLNSEGRVNQKFVNDAAAKRLAEHIKRTSNIGVTSRTPQQTFNPEQKSDYDKQVEFIWKNG